MCDDLYLYFVSSWRERRENRVTTCYIEDRRKMSRRTTTQKKKKNDGRSKLKRPSSSWQPTLKHYFGGKVDINVASVHMHR